MTCPSAYISTTTPRAIPHSSLQVLYAFHASRGNWQAAAAAMLALSRRLVGEGAGDAATLARAELALGAAVSALRCALGSSLGVKRDVV